MVPSVRGTHARCCDALDRVALQVNQVHVRLVEALVVTLLERGAFGAERVGRLERCEEFRDRRVHDPGTCLVPPEVVCGAVGGEIKTDVFEGSGPEVKAAGLPCLFKDSTPLLGRHFQRADFVADNVKETAGRFIASLKDLRILKLGPILFSNREAALLHR